MNVYHGSTIIVEHPLVSYGRDNLDFGKGFYVTDIQIQASKWARQLASRRPGSKAILNVYELDMEKARNFNYLQFDAYNEEWLDFIVGSRTGNKPWQGYDIIEGGIANDKVFDTIEIYMSGQISKMTAIGKLRYEQPNNQLCLLSQKAIDTCLHFIKSEIIQ